MKNKLVIAIDLSSKISGISIFKDKEFIGSIIIKMKPINELGYVEYCNQLRKNINVALEEVINKENEQFIESIDFVIEENKRHYTLITALGMWCSILSEYSNITEVEITTVNPKTWYNDLKLGAWNDLSNVRKKNSLNYYNKQEHKNEKDDNISDSYCIGKWFMENDLWIRVENIRKKRKREREKIMKEMMEKNK